MRPSWMLCFGRRGCWAMAVVDAVLWKDAPPLEFSRLKLMNTHWHKQHVAADWQVSTMAQNVQNVLQDERVKASEVILSTFT